jgi:PAS domain S-box-containing protein/putative nucleotidyltransferase with HDIG domain
MSSEILRKDLNVQIRQLEALILLMAGATLASLQIVHYVFLSSGIGLTAFQMLLDWLFSMSIIFLLVHFSFREISKMHNDLVVQREQASKAEKRIQHIIDTTQDMIFTLDRDGNFTFVNRAVEEITGYTVDNILTNDIQSILSPEYRTFVPDQLKQYREIAGRHLYVDLMKNDGNLVPVELSFLPIKNRDNELIGFQGIARDISERKEAEKAQKEKERYLKAIARVGQLLLETKKDIPYKKILEILCDTSEIRNAFILLGDELSGKNARAFAKDDKNKEPAKGKDGTQTPNVYINYVDSKSDGSKEPCPKPMDGEEIAKGLMELSRKEGAIVSSSHGDSASLILPVMVNSEFAGVIGFEKPKQSKGFKPVEINLLATSATMLAQTIEKQKASSQIKQHFVQLTKMISRAMFAVDPYTVSHQERLAVLASMVGEKLGLSEAELEWLQVGALLHDIGKAAIPNTILSKPGKLTDEEWVLVRSHVRRGYEMLQDMDLPEQVMDMVMNHHERLNGTGYPQGIRRDELSLEARILGLCDVVEAMSSHRPYRPARKKDEVVDELQQGREKLYDPRVVDLLLEIIERNEFDFDFPKSSKVLAMN